MNRDNTYYKNLMHRYLNNDCTKDEVEELFNFIDLDDANRWILEELQTSYQDAIQQPGEFREKPWSRRIKNELLRKTGAKRMFITTGRRMLFAAAILLIVLCGSILSYINFGKKTPVHQPIVKQKDQTIVPGGEKATLVLADGSVIDLTQADNGDIALDDNVRVASKNGIINYAAINGDRSLLKGFNIVNTPRGGYYTIVLPDGSKIWLNAASSLKFPTYFDSSDRKVELTGEGYFEVAQKKLPGGRKQPFFVVVNNSSGGAAIVEVLGTHFNIMAYDEEREINTTLIEGAVKVKLNNINVSLQPGQQAQLTKTDQQISVLKKVDVESVLAWKNGEFKFDNTDLKTIMRQIGRWYDVHVTYDGNIPSIGFSGKIKRKNNIGQLLEILEATHKVKFRIDGRSLIVSPYEKQ